MTFTKIRKAEALSFLERIFLPPFSVPMDSIEIIL